MKPFNENSSHQNNTGDDFLLPRPPIQQPSTLRRDVERALQQYFENVGDDSVSNLYQLVLNEVEAPLLEAVLRHSGSNQSKASIMLGLNRGTLRKKLKQHGML